MKFDDAVKKEAKYYAQVFKRLPLLIVRGEGVHVWDSLGRQYLDFASGVAVNTLGHCHPEVVHAIVAQASRLIHTSNWFYTEAQLELAETLAHITGLEKAFITNSGTESVEAALKLAKSATGKKEIIAMQGSFHGRTMGSLSVTSNEAYKKPFEPMVPNVKFVPYNNVEAAESAITDDTAAVIVEPIQGEGGVIVPDEGYLKTLRDVTAEKEVLLIVDEVQTGFGRTGTMFAYQLDQIKPDIVCLAKAMGSGMAVGAITYAGIDFKAGEHGGTLGGNPLACAVANATIEVIKRERLSEKALEVGRKLSNSLTSLGLSPRGRGLMLAVPMQEPRNIVEKLIEQYVLTIYSKDALRILPPLVIEEPHIHMFINALSSALGLGGEQEEEVKKEEPVGELRLTQALDHSDDRVDPAFVAEVGNLLPTTDCGDCGEESCKKFAEKVLLGERKASECPHIKPENYNKIMLILDDYFH